MMTKEKRENEESNICTMVWKSGEKGYLVPRVSLCAGPFPTFSHTQIGKGKSCKDIRRWGAFTPSSHHPLSFHPTLLTLAVKSNFLLG